VTEQQVHRRLAAILAADVVSYSALMERDEEGTYAEFERLKRELIAPSLSRHEGRLIKTFALNPNSYLVWNGRGRGPKLGAGLSVALARVTITMR
jgi:hypothetical protein